MPCLKASTSMARSFLEETVFCMGTVLARVVVKPTAKCMVTCKLAKVVTKSGVGDGDVEYDVTGVSADHNVQRMAEYMGQFMYMLL